MVNETAQPERWLLRTEAYRAIADAVREASSRGTILSLAGIYEGMALGAAAREMQPSRTLPVASGGLREQLASEVAEAETLRARFDSE